MLSKIRLFSTETYSFGPVFNFISNMMSALGCTVYKNPKPNIFIKCYFYVFYVLFVGSVTSNLITIIVEDDYEFKFHSAVPLIGISAAGFKIINFWIWKERHYNIQNIAIKNTASLDTGGSYEAEIGLKYRKFVNLVAEIVFYSDACAYFGYILQPLFLDRSMPFHYEIIGIPHLGHPGFEITYIYVVVELLYAVTIFVAFDVSFFTFCFYASSQLELCVKYCTNIGDKSGLYNTDEKQRKLIKHVAKLFSETYDLISECSSLYSFAILVAALAHVGMFGVHLVHLFTGSYPGFIIMQIAAMATQFYLYALSGQLVISKGEEISVALYNSKWYQLEDISDRKMVLFLLTSSQRCAGFSIGGFSKLSLPSFTAFAKTCYGVAACLMKYVKN